MLIIYRIPLMGVFLLNNFRFRAMSEGDLMMHWHVFYVYNDEQVINASGRSQLYCEEGASHPARRGKNGEAFLKE